MRRVCGVGLNPSASLQLAATAELVRRMESEGRGNLTRQRELDRRLARIRQLRKPAVPG